MQTYKEIIVIDCLRRKVWINEVTAEHHLLNSYSVSITNKEIDEAWELIKYIEDTEKDVEIFLGKRLGQLDEIRLRREFFFIDTDGNKYRVIASEEYGDHDPDYCNDNPNHEHL